MNMKRMLSVMMVLTLVISMLAGCTSGSEPEGPVEITVWEQMDPSAQEVFDKIAEAFMAENPNITVTRNHYETEELRTTFQSSALAGQGPELVYGPNDNVGIFTVSGLLRPVDEVVSADFLGKLDSNAIDAGVVDGKKWMIPDINGNQIALLYNKDMVEKAPETWEELVAMATPHQNIDPANPEESTYGLLYNEREPFWFIAFYGGYGGRVFDADLNPTLDNDAMVKALQFVVDLKQKDGLGDVEMNYDIADSLFKQGKAAFIFNGAWSWKSYMDEGMNIGIAPYPKLPGGDRGLPTNATKGYMISKFMDDSKKEAVATFLDFALNAENNADYALANSQSPTNLDAMKLDKVTSNELMQASVETIKYTTPMPIVPEMRAIWDAMRPELEAVIAGDITPEEAAKNMQVRAEEGIKTIRGE